MRVPLSNLEETVAVMKLVPNEHAQQLNLPQPQFFNKVVEDRVTRREKSHGPSEDEKKQSRSLRFDAKTKW